jgi:cardiolipin synthase
VFWLEDEWALGFFQQTHMVMLALLRAGLAMAVTVHVLRRKRDVGASIGWIGLAWFSPIAGGLFYFVFGINRVRRRARREREDRPEDVDGPVVPLRTDHLRPLEIAAGRITRRPALAGNSVTVLRNGDEAYPKMLAAIASAKHSIGLSSYLLRGDAAGNRFIKALAAASQRGVEVRVLVDGIGSGYFSSAAYRRLRRRGIPVARFMHSVLPWRMPFINLRTHKKILVVDGRQGFTGGMNIAAENMLSTRPRDPVRDTHFAVEGPVVAQLSEAFASDWSFVTGEELEGPAWFPQLAPTGGGALARVITSGPDEDLEKIEFIVLQAIACARRSISLMTPYFLPDERLISALAVAAMRGVEVDVLVPARSNHRVVDWASRANSVPLLSAGCRLWNNPPPFDHSKIMVVDRTWCMIGSANWDMRSFRLNFELNMEIYHPELAGVLEAMMVSMRGQRVTHDALEESRLVLRLRDAAMRLMLPYL